MSLVVVGSTVVDIILARTPRLPSWPRHSEFTAANLVLLAEAPLVTLGGNGANAAYVAACSGARVDLATNLGEDAFGRVAREWMTKAGCRLLRSKRTHRTGINVTAANAQHARASFFYPGDPPLLPSLRELPPKTTHFLVCGWPHPPFLQVERCFRSLRKRGMFTAMDTGPFLGRPWAVTELKPILGSLDLLLANEYELNELMRSADLSASLRKLRRYFHGHLVVKQGSRGALWLPESSCEPHVIPAPKVRAENTVGAGDSFNGALLAALMLRNDFATALTRAAKMAAKVVASTHGVLGAQE